VRAHASAAWRFYYSSSMGFGELHDAGLITLRAQLMILRQERAVDLRNGIGNGFVHSCSVRLRKLQSLERIADVARRVADAAIQRGNAFNLRKIEIPE